MTQADPGGVDIESFVARADAALYRAKQQGRNRVCFEPDSPPPVPPPRQERPPTPEFFAPDGEPGTPSG